MSLRRFNNYDLAGMKPVLAWNPLAMRCDPVGEGCRNCWHIKMCDRLSVIEGLMPEVRDAYAGGEVVATKGFYDSLPDNRVIAVQFMGDLWHKEVPQSYRDSIFCRIRDTPRSIFLLLTKRPERVTEQIPDNGWLGASAWDQASLLRTRDEMARCGRVAKHRWLSLEPLLDRFIEMSGGGLYEFVAFGPETRFGREIEDSMWMDRIVRLADCYPKASFYDKRTWWIKREWPMLWQEVAREAARSN